MPDKSSTLPRVLTALVGIPLIVGVCLWGALPFTAFLTLLALIGRTELHRAYARLGLQPNGLLTLFGALAPAVAYFLRPTPGQASFAIPVSTPLFLACLLVVASLWETGAASHEKRVHAGSNMAFGLLCGAYLSLFGGVALLRLSAWDGPRGLLPSADGGALLVLTTAACTIASDSAAYFVGRMAGRHKLAEGLSKGKTIEGFLGGVAGSVLIGALVGAALLGSPRVGLCVGALASLLGPLGDLFKSTLKREIGVKDFGALLPGHGGVLDRFDSLLFAAPVVALAAPALATLFASSR